MKYWFITSIAKLLLFTYVAFEAVLGLSATVGGGLSRAAPWKMRLLGHYIGENAVNLRRFCVVREFVLCAGDPLLQGEYQSCMLLSLYGSENACFAPVCGWGCAVCSSHRGLPPHHQSAAPMASVRYPGRWAVLALRGVHVLQGHDSWYGAVVVGGVVWLFQLTHCYIPLLSHVDLRASQICAQIHARR